MGERFTGKVAIVTGGSSGIGAATVERLAREGATVVVADLNPPAETSASIVFHQTDVARSADVTALLAAVAAQFGRLDVLVNNAGIGCLVETPDMAEADWDRIFAVNVTAIFHTCKIAIPVMRANGGGAIVNVASISGLSGDYGFAAYSASKAAVINYTRTLALDCARDNIRVNALCPGLIETPMAVPKHAVPQRDRQEWLDAIPLRRAGQPAEIANVIVFLASDEASYMTGSIVVADGGKTAHTGQPNVIAQVKRRAVAQGA
jgi:meso-butanediol dehydrogenase / (S,S)-butanediol dehydrogenase / diacetyl reductase